MRSCSVVRRLSGASGGANPEKRDRHEVPDELGKLGAMSNGSRRLWRYVGGQVRSALAYAHPRASFVVARLHIALIRRFMPAAALVALGAAVLPTSASAFDHHFSVALEAEFGSPNANSVRLKDKLLDPRNRHDRVGRDYGKCRFIPRKEKVKCHAVIHLQGEIGGFGDIRIRG
jgi:hypothetical protein